MQSSAEKWVREVVRHFYAQRIHPGADPLGEQIFAGYCASCRGWSGVSPLTSGATLTADRAVKDASAVNVAQMSCQARIGSHPRACCSCPPSRPRIPTPRSLPSPTMSPGALARRPLTLRQGTSPSFGGCPRSSGSAHDDDLRTRSLECWR